MMEKKSDRELGMFGKIDRRDFIQNTVIASLGLMLPISCMSDTDAETSSANSTPSDYPPTKTGMRGAHKGSYENAHALARNGMKFDNPIDSEEWYDLIVVGAGISGLTAAYEYRKKFGDDSKILILDNHDDFGGHAKRNEFNQSDDTRLSWAGTMNLEYHAFSKRVLKFVKELGIDVKTLNKELDFKYGDDKPSIWFDKETFGKDVLVPGFSIFQRNLDNLDLIDQFPISEKGRKELKEFYSSDKNVLAGLSETEIEKVLYDTSYTDFLADYCKLPEEVIAIFNNATDTYWGVQPHSLSVSEAMMAWLPGAHLLGNASSEVAGTEESEDVAMFPDGNASIARLLVCSLIPSVSENVDASNIAIAKLDYGQLDQANNPIKIRLSSTVVKAENTDKGVAVNYVCDEKTIRVRAKHSVLACYHSIIPHICPELPEEQKKAQKNQVKHPMLVTNVLVKNSKAFENLDISGAYCPGRMHAKVFITKGVNTAGYQPNYDTDAAVPIMLWGMVSPPNSNVHIHQQLREARMDLLMTSFEDFEREVRTVLDGLLGPAGFNVKEDVLAITVNRWPHGYSYGYLDLWDDDYKKGEAPHEIARQPIGNITIANSDAAASAYTQAAIEEAFRAVEELK